MTWKRMLLTLKALLKHLSKTELIQMTWKRVILTFKALVKHLVKTKLRHMTWQSMILTLKALLEALGEHRVKADDVEENDPDFGSNDP
jgi:hypothetical protein